MYYKVNLDDYVIVEEEGFPRHANTMYYGRMGIYENVNQIDVFTRSEAVEILSKELDSKIDYLTDKLRRLVNA